jgi:hypothetical protein
LLPLCFRLLHGSDDHPRPATQATQQPPALSLPKCPLCGGSMHIQVRLTRAQLLLRAPPDRCAP